MKTLLFISLGFCIVLNVFSQDILTIEDAISATLKNNYDIQLSKNNVLVAENNKSIYNSGYLPSIEGTSNVQFSNNDAETTFEDGSLNSISGAESRSYGASIGFNYTIFNGLNRLHAFNRLKEQFNLTELQAREVIEETIISLSEAYYEVARLTENVVTQEEILNVSKQRLTRVKYNVEYGQGTRLDVLNAEVDVNNDSISYLDIKRQLTNAKRDLNVVLGKNVNATLKIDTTVTYAINLKLEALINQVKTHNVTLLQFKKNIELSQYDLKINKSSWLPTIGVNGTYDWTSSNNDATSPFSPVKSTRNGFNAGLNLSWNIFDGGRNIINVQNAKIAIDNQNILIEQLEDALDRDINNAWETYQNTMFTLKVQQSNVSTNKHNFERTSQQYKLGQVTSIDFRQAQVNLSNAELNLSQAKYNLKNHELRLLQLAGMLL